MVGYAKRRTYKVYIPEIKSAAITKDAQMIDMNNGDKTEPDISLDMYEDDEVDECPFEVKIHTRGFVCTRAEAPEEPSQDEPHLDDIKHYPVVRRSNMATKKT